MPSRFLNNININDSYTLPVADGVADQIITTDGAGQLSFMDQGDVIAGEADKAKSVILRVKNSTLSAMTKGQVICENVSISPPSGNLIEVGLADNNAAGRMPALGILNEDLDAAGGNKDEGDAIMFGKVSGIDTSAFSVGDEVFVSDVPGGLTTTKPTGVKYIQKVGVVIRDDNNNGTIEVFGAGRVNDVPTPLYVDHANQRLGIGEGNPDALLHLSGNSPTIKLEDDVASDYYNPKIEFYGSTFGGSVGFLSNPAIETLQLQYTSIALAKTTYLRLKNGEADFSSNVTNGTTLKTDGVLQVAGSNDSYFSNGNVGIGTTSPSTDLEVSSTGVNGVDISQSASNASQSGRLFFTNDTPTEGFALFNSSGTFRINSGGIPNDTSGNNRISIIGSSGNVGIGTTNPTTKLEVQDGSIKLNSTSSYPSTNSIIATWNGSSSPPMGNLSWHQNPGFTGSEWSHYNTSSPYTQARIRLIGDASSGGMFVNLNGFDMFTIKASTGNVGINTTSPDYKLEVDGTLGVNRTDGIVFAGSAAAGVGNTITSDTSNNFIFSTSLPSVPYTTTPKMTILNGGNVGIGTTNPNYKLDVYGNLKIGTTGALSIGQSPYSTTIFYIGAGNGSEIAFGAPASNTQNVSVQGDLYSYQGSVGTKINGSFNNKISYNGDNYLNSGNLGIGTFFPQEKAHVSGSSNVRLEVEATDSTVAALKLTNTAGSYASFVNASGELNTYDYNAASVRTTLLTNGNFGIDATSPQSKLQVNGGVQLANDTASPSASKVGTFRYRSASTGMGTYASYVDMCMQTGTSTYAWVNIVTNSW